MGDGTSLSHNDDEEAGGRRGSMSCQSRGRDIKGVTQIWLQGFFLPLDPHTVLNDQSRN